MIISSLSQLQYVLIQPSLPSKIHSLPSKILPLSSIIAIISIKNFKGVSAAFSAPLLGSIPVTHRGVSNQVVMCTGYGRNNTSPDLIKYHPEQTVVFLMAVGRLRTLCDNLVNKAGFPLDTPVGIVERAGCPDQRTVVGTMVNIADLAKEYDVKPPSTIVVGEVVNVLLTEEDFGSVATGEGVVQQGLVRTLED